MRYALIVGAWELVRPLVRHGLTLAMRAFWAWELRREMRAG
jgi:hypothetical protein